MFPIYIKMCLIATLKIISVVNCNSVYLLYALKIKHDFR